MNATATRISGQGCCCFYTYSATKRNIRVTKNVRATFVHIPCVMEQEKLKCDVEACRTTYS